MIDDDPHAAVSYSSPRFLAVLVGACIAGVALTAFWFLTAPKTLFDQADPRLTAGDPQVGRLVFLAGSCGSCHATPGQANPLLLGGGMALASPFGVFRPPNISPDVKDGIGSWSAADLANALIAGVSPASRHYYPAFPYTSYTGLDVRDVADLYAYLRTLPAVSGRTPPHDLPFFARIRRLIGLWKLFFFARQRQAPNVAGDAVFNRGAYLVEAVTHCAECHSTRNVLGAIKPTTRYAGGPDAEGTGFVPNITARRLSGWTQADVSEMLATGKTPQGGHVGSAMVDVVANLSQLPQADRDAIARYIKSLTPVDTPHP